MTIQRSIKRGDVRTFDESYNKGFKSVQANEVDADFNILFDSWNFGLDGSLAIADGTVTTAKLMDGAVTGPKIAPNAVSSGNIADGAVGTSEILDLAVTAAKIAGGAVGSSQLAPDSVDASKIVDASVGTAELADAAVTTAKIAPLAITTPLISNGAVTDAKIASVSWAKLTGAPTSMAPTGPAGGSLAGTYPNPTIAPSAVGPTEILDGCVSTTELAPNVVGRLTPPYGVPQASRVLTVAADGLSVVWQAAPPATLAPGQVTTTYIADSPNGVTDAKITSVSWAKVTGAPTTYPPSGAAGGDLVGTYPNPTIKPGLIPTIPTSLPPSGPAGGNLAGNYPNPSIGASQVTNSMVADVAWAKITGTGTGVTAGTYGSSTAIPRLTLGLDGRVSVVSEVAVSIPPGTAVGPTAPASPAVGQMWWRSDPDGNLYIWYNDGTSSQWVPAVSSAGGPWSVSGATLTPTDATKAIYISGVPDDGNVLSWLTGTSPVRGRLTTAPTAPAIQMSLNRRRDGTLDDSAKPGWLAELRTDIDSFKVYRAPAGTGQPAAATLLTVDGAGKLTVPGSSDTTDQSALVFGTRTQKGRLNALPGLDWVGLTLNRRYTGSAWVRDDTGQPSWTLALGVGSDSLLVSRESAAGVAATLLTLDNVGGVALQHPATGFSQFIAYGYGTTGGQHKSLQAQGTVAAPTPTLVNDILGQFAMYGCYQAGANYGQQILMRGVAAENWTNTARGCNLVFYTTPGGSASASSSMQLDGGGNITISGATGTKASGTTWANPSDRRLKDDITDYTTGLAAIVALTPRTFLYNGRGGSQRGLRGYGYIADEVEPVMPEMLGVTKTKLNADDEEDTDIQTLDTSNVTLALVNAVKEIEVRLRTLEVR